MWVARLLSHFFVRRWCERTRACVCARARQDLTRPAGQAFLYPAYQSFKAVRESNPEKHAQWLTYWIVNSCVPLTARVACD